MKKIVLIDGNNFMFRSYYATAYSGSLMRNSKGFPTNALFGFVSMINKIIEEEKPTYMVVAFDIGINFRKKEFSFYKEGREQTPDDLKKQMPIAKDVLDAMGIKYLEKEPYEADDIIGTVVKICEADKDFNATIISSDKDLLQLINFETDVKLLKQTGYIRYNEKTFYDDYGIKPTEVIDLKSLMGDSSDNIPGVKGIGEKTALKLLHKYKTLDGIYENIDKIKGSVKDKLINDKENAYISKKIATIYKDVPLDIKLDNLEYKGPNNEMLKEIYSELEFNSFLKNLDVKTENKKIKYIEVNDNINVVLDKKVALYLEVDNEVYTKASIIGASICDNKYLYYFDKENVNIIPDIIKDKIVITYDHKKNMYLLSDLKNASDDIMISSYLLNYNVKDDIAYLANILGYDISYYDNLMKDNNQEDIINNICLKAKFIYETNDLLKEKLEKEKMIKLYEETEMPLIEVLASMEKEGIKVNKDELIKQSNEVNDKIISLTKDIYEHAGCQFNIASPKQLGEILFEKMAIAKGKKNKTGYKTDVDTLEKLILIHPIIPLILEFRNLSKLKSTYTDGLQNYVNEKGFIHTIFKQIVTRTGRLSSVEPNLQNIPIKDELGRLIRKAFVPKNDLFLSCDYSQIELRVLAHVSNCQPMIKTFLEDGDIHTKVASDIHEIPIEEVTKKQRSSAKAVIFGIVYGISSFGLMDNLHITKKDADNFINKYYELYPQVKDYMDNTIKKAYEKGYVTTLFNRKRIIDELHNKNYMIRKSGERMAINTPIQGSAADIIKMAMIKINEIFKEKNIKSKMILQVHDELIFDVIEEEKDIVKDIVKKTMENIIKLNVPLKVSVDFGSNWYETN